MANGAGSETRVVPELTPAGELEISG